MQRFIESHRVLWKRLRNISMWHNYRKFITSISYKPLPACDDAGHGLISSVIRLQFDLQVLLHSFKWLERGCALTTLSKTAS